MMGADILIENGKIAAVGKGIGGATGNRVVDCSTLIAVPGFITTHHHKYETPQRSADADGYITFAGDPEQQKLLWPYESYSNLQNLWNSGRMTDVDGHVWEFGAPTQTPDDLYISHLVGSLAELKSRAKAQPTALLECSGNAPAGSLIGNTKWTGTPLAPPVLAPESVTRAPGSTAPDASATEP
jgi:hypothetical protein